MEQIQNKIKFVCISDTHNRHQDLKIPDGDVLIHAGDFTSVGDTDEMEQFINFIKSQPHKHKIVVAGNHDLSLDIENFKYFTEDSQFKFYFKKKQSKEQWVAQKKELEKHCTYIENDMVELYGYKIYGSPFSVEFYGWAFMKEIPDLKPIWENIPTETDILITHGPPYNILDKCKSGQLAGCPNLREQVLNRIKPQYHIFGHIHETYGQEKIDNTTFINASSVNYNYLPTNDPIVFELPIKN